MTNEPKGRNRNKIQLQQEPEYPTDSNRQIVQTKVSQEILALSSTLDQMDIIFTELSIPKQLHIYSSQLHAHHSQGQNTCRGTKVVSI